MSRINYDLGRIRAVAFDVDGVLSPAVVPLGPDGLPQRMANLRDGYAMVQAVKQGLQLAIISGADAPGVRERFEIIGVQNIFLGHLDKLPVLEQWMASLGLEPDEVAYVGDDIPDLAPMAVVGLPVAPRDACTECKAAARFIAGAPGGYGVARELIEEILRARSLWPVASAATGV